MILTKLIARGWLLFLALGIIGYIFTDVASGTFYDLPVTDLLYVSSIYAHVISILGMITGAKFASYILSSNRSSTFNVFQLVVLTTKPATLVAVCSLAAIVSIWATLSAYGLEGLFFRNYYLPESSVAPIIAQVSSIVGSLFSAMLICSTRRIFKYVGWLIGFIFIFLSFAKGSRFVVVALGLYIFLPEFVNYNPSLSRWNKLLRLFLLTLLAVTLLVPLMYTILNFRDDSVYGVTVYLLAIPSAIDSLFSDGFKSIWELVLNISFSIPVTELTINGFRHETDDILVALSPFTGNFAGWDALAPRRRINEVIPFSALGELYGYSLILCFVYMSAAGFLIGFLEIKSFRMKYPLNVIFSLLLISFALIFFLLIPQYNLRSATRILYYLFFSYVIFAFLSLILPAVRRKIASR